MNKKIAFVTSRYIDGGFSSGGIKLNYILVKELSKLGYRIDLFTDKVSSYKDKFFNKIYPLSSLNELKKEYDYILTDKGFIPSDITYIHDHSYPYRVQYMSNKLKHFLYKIFIRKKHFVRLNEYTEIKNNLQKTKKIIVSSNILKQDMIDNFGINPNNIVIIPPPIEEHEPFNKEKNPIFTFGISTVGFERKGGYILLKAIKELKKIRNDFKVIFIYSSNNFFVKLYKKLYGIEKYCEFIGIQKDINKFYNSIDCLLMPSIIEPFGMVATEALSNGCPVITAKHCGASDFIIDDKNGYVYDGSKNPSKELAKAMNKILSTDKNILENMSEFCINSVQNCYAKEFAKEYIKVFEIIDKENIFAEQ